MAGGSSQRHADPARQAARDVKAIPPVNASLILFVKMAACGAAIGRSFVAGVVLSARSSGRV
jgi:hypothetical protein